MRRARAVALAAVVLLLAGCSEIPTGGPVQDGTTEGPNDTTIVYLPNPPAAGATPQEIVNGFVAAASAGGDLRVAREYLTPSFAQVWNPTAKVLVQDGQPVVAAPSDDEVTLRVPVGATVKADGTYTQRKRQVALDYRLVRRSGQWRIDVAPDGIVLGPTVFQRNFTPRALEFFDPTWSRLVPDVRWFPASRDPTVGGTSPEAVLDALIAGPVGPVAGGVVANAMRGANLVNVSTDGSDVTTVALSVPAADASAQATTRMQQQILQSLQLSSPAALRLVVNGRAIPQAKVLDGDPAPFSGFALRNGRFGSIDADGGLTDERTLGPRIVALHPDTTHPGAITVSVRQHLAAVLTDQQQVAIVTPGGSRVVDRRPGLIAPALDQRGWVYSVQGDGPDGLQASNARQQGIGLVADLGGSAATKVTKIEVSPDGVRMLVLVQAASGPRAFVAGIQRNADGTPIGLTTEQYPVDLGGAAGTGVDATWVDSGHVAVLVSAPNNSSQQVQVQQIGALTSGMGQLANAEAIVGTSSAGDLRVLLQNGELWVFNGTIWRRESTSSTDVDVLAVQR